MGCRTNPGSFKLCPAREYCEQSTSFTDMISTVTQGPIFDAASEMMGNAQTLMGALDPNSDTYKQLSSQVDAVRNMIVSLLDISQEAEMSIDEDRTRIACLDGPLHETDDTGRLLRTCGSLALNESERGYFVRIVTD